MDTEKKRRELDINKRCDTILPPPPPLTATISSISSRALGLLWSLARSVSMACHVWDVYSSGGIFNRTRSNSYKEKQRRKEKGEERKGKKNHEETEGKKEKK